jgi:hypothetical protein
MLFLVILLHILCQYYDFSILNILNINYVLIFWTILNKYISVYRYDS